tara:strand:+ start:4574 stop:5320 length:747 start_codon:yes stop_codon:yes gene_type:complete
MLEKVYTDKIYYKYKDGKYYLFANQKELKYIYFNLYTDKKNVRYIKIGETNNNVRRKRENDKLFSKNSKTLLEKKIPYARETEQFIHKTYLSKKHKAFTFYDIDFDNGGIKEYKFNNTETYYYDKVKNKVNKIIEKIKQIEHIDTIDNLKKYDFIKYVTDYIINNKYKDNKTKTEEFTFSESINANINKYGKYRVCARSSNKINNLKTKYIKSEWENKFIKEMCILINKNKAISKKQLEWINKLCEKY